MREPSSRGESVRETRETQPNWGAWSSRRSLAWTLVSVVLLAVVAGGTLGGGALLSGHGPGSGTDTDLVGTTTVGEPNGGTTVPSGAEDVSPGTGSSTQSTRVTDQSPARPATWNEYDAVVVFRNDDIQPYYRSETMQAVDQVFVEEGVPVTWGVIPQVTDGPAITETPLCSYLRETVDAHPGQFEVALHGYTHEQRTTFYGGSEFGGLDAATQRAFVDEGTRTLTECVGRRPTTFVPPLNSYDDATVDALREANYTVVSGGNWFTREYYDESTVFEREGLVHAPSSGAFVANWTTGAFYDQATLERQFDWAVEDGEVYVQMFHYQDFDTPERLDHLRSFVEYTNASGSVRYMTLSELGERVENGTLKQTDDGWEVYESGTGSG